MAICSPTFFYLLPWCQLLLLVEWSRMNGVCWQHPGVRGHGGHAGSASFLLIQASCWTVLKEKVAELGNLVLIAHEMERSGLLRCGFSQLNCSAQSRLLPP